MVSFRKKAPQSEVLTSKILRMAHPSPVRRRRQNPPMPRQPAADRVSVHPETSSNSHQSEQWPRFEVCIDGRCPIEDTLNVIAGRWKILILWWLQDDELRFGELRRHIPTITQKMLTQQLRQMEEEGLVHREVFAQVPPKVIYALTERGHSLRPVLRSLYEWSRDHPRQP